MEDKNKIKEKYLEYQFLMQQIQQLQENITALEKHILDLNCLKENLDSVSGLKSGEEALIPLGNGIFLRGNLNDSKNVVINVGAGVCIENTVDGAKTIVSKQAGDVNEVLGQMQGEAVKVVGRIQELQSELETAQKEKK